MDNIDQLLKDFYDKYGQQPLDNTKLQTIKSTYGNNYDQLLTDLYSKYNQPLDNNKLKLIKDTYKLETPIANTVQPDILNEYIGFLESNGRYDAKNDVYLPKLGRTSKATGKYQHIWDLHKDDIIKTTGIKDRSTYLKTPEAQEAYQQVLNTQYQQALPEYIKIAQNRGLQLDEKELIYIMHHEGVDGGKQFLETGVSKFGSEKAINNRLKAGRRWMEKNGLSIGSLTTNTSDQTNQMESIPNTSLTELINNEAVKLANKKNKEKLGSMSYLDKMAYDWNRRSIIGDIMDGNGYGMNKATKSEIEAAKIELLQSGKYGKFKSAEELAAVLDPNYKENIEKANAAGDKVQKSLEDDFNTDAGLFDTSPFGDNRGYRRDGRTGQKQADIIPNFWVGDDVGQYWMGVDKIMTLTEHPLITKNPKKYNYKEQKELNQHLRNIQADISKPQQIKREATTGYINNYLQYAGNRIQAIEKEFTTKYGNLQKLSEEAKLKLQQDPLYQEYQELATGYETEYANLESKNATFKLAEANDNLEKLFNKKEDINHKKNYATLGFLEKSLQNVTSFAKDALTAAARMPGDVAVLAGTGVDTVLDTDLGTTRAIASSRNAGKISTTAIKEGAIPLSVKLDTEDEIYAIYNNKNEIERFTDGKYFTITDDPNSETFKRLVQEEKKSLNSGKPSWGFNTDAFLHGVREPMIDMVPLILGGGIAKTIATKAASVVGKTSRVGNALTKVANSDKFLTFAGSYAGFSGKMMDSAIKEGGLVDSGDIFLATTAKVGLEAVIEAYNPMGGRLFTDKLFSSLSKQQVKQLSKIISEEGVFKALPIISRQFRKEIIENGLGESMEEILATIIEPSVVNNILNNTIGTSYDTSFSVKDVAESALVGMASGFAMGGILESGPTALSAINNPSSVIQESLRAALQNKQIFDKIIEENKNVDLQNASDQDVEKVKAKYDNIKKIMDNAAIYSEKVFKEHPDTGHVPSSGMQTLYSNVAFNKARKENKKYDLEEDVNKNIASIDQDTKKLKELDLFIGAGLDFFNGIADTNKEAKIMSDTELKDNYFTVYNDVKDIVAKIGNKKNSDAQKLALIKAETKLALIKAKNKTENKVNPEVITAAEEVVKVETAAAKQEAKELETKEAVIKGTAKPEQVEAELAKAKQSVDDLFTGQKTLKDNELPDFSIDLIQELLENTPDMLKGEVSQYIDKKLEAINAQAYRQQVQNFNQQEKTAKPTNSTKLSPDVAFDTRYNGNTELENTEWDTFKKDYINQLEVERDNAFTRGEADTLIALDEYLIAFKDIINFKDAYINDPKFREFVDANTNITASKPNTAITKDQKETEADKKAKAEAKKVSHIAKKQENIKDIAKDKELYEAAKLIVEKQYATQAFLVKELGITNEKAKELLQKLEDNGIIGPHVVGKTREIYIKSIEEFNNLVPPVSQSGTANTITVNASGSSVSNIEAKKADIEKRRQEDLQENTIGLKTARKGDKGIYWTTFKGARQEREVDVPVTIKAVSRLGVLFTEEEGWKNFSDDASKSFTKWINFRNTTREQEINAKYDAELKALEQPVQSTSVQQEQKLPVINGKVEIPLTKGYTLQGFGTGIESNSVADALNVNMYLTDESPVYFEVNGDKIDGVVYFNPETKVFEEYKPGLSRILLRRGLGYTGSGNNRVSEDEYYINKIKKDNLSRLQVRVKKGTKPLLLKGTFIPINIGNIPNTSYKIEILSNYKDNNVAEYIIKDGDTEITRINGSNYNSVKTTLLDKAKNQEEKDAIETHFNPINKPKLSLENIESMLPDMYVVGQSYASKDSLVLQSKDRDNQTASNVDRFVDRYQEKNKHVSKQVIDGLRKILENETINGKVIYIKDGIIIPMDTIRVMDDPESLKIVTEHLEGLALEEKGKASWRFNVDDIKLAEAVRARSEIFITESDTNNIRGRYIEFFSGGKSGRAREDGKHLYYIKEGIKEDGEKGIVEVYVTPQEAADIISGIRVNIDHDQLRNTDKHTSKFKEKLQRVLRLPSNGEFAPIYNRVFVEATSEDTDNVSETVVTVTSTPKQEVTAPDIKVDIETKNISNIPTTEIPADNDISTGDNISTETNIDFKISDKTYEGKVEKAISYIKIRFEEIGVEVNDEVLRNLVKNTAAEGSKVWGAFHNAMVTLSSLSGEKIGKHEAMHVVFKMFLNKQQQIDILNELWNKHKDDPRYKGKEEQFKKEMQEFLTSDTFDTKQDFKLTDQEQVNFSLKAVEILQSDKAKQVFDKGRKNNWSLDRILSELQVPKEQKELIKQIENDFVQKQFAIYNEPLQYALELANQMSYTVEINTAKVSENIESVREVEPGLWNFRGDDFYSYSEAIDAKNEYNESRKETPTQYYSNLTVPGGTNYTENEISTPLITPSIKGHAQFSTDKGIGWFRSDDKAISQMEKREMWNPYTEQVEEYEEERGSIDPIKTRRILEIQSDLFQKGRDKEDLINKNPKDYKEQIQYKKELIAKLEQDEEVESYLVQEAIKSQKKELAVLIKNQELELKFKNLSDNQFLQLLNKDNNWVTFFIKSIIQDSAKKGYKKVLFPLGDTASKIEGHSTLEEFKKEKEDRIEILERENRGRYIVISDNNKRDVFTTEQRAKEVVDFYNKEIDEDDPFAIKSYYEYRPLQKEILEANINEINQLKQELERVEGPEGFGALRPIYNFYENTIANILNKTYGKGNVKQVTDEYGNTWNEIIIESTRDTSNILLKSSSEQFYSEQSILTQLQEDLSDAFEDYKNTLLLPEGFSKKYPIISKFINNLFNFLKKNYLIGRSYITNKKSIDQLFYEVENNILGRDFIGRRKKNVRDIFQKALDSLSEKNKPDFKISNWNNLNVKKYSDFLAVDLFTDFLKDTYNGQSNVNEIIATYKNTSIKSIIANFNRDLKDRLNSYKTKVTAANEISEDSQAYATLSHILDDIYKQYASKEANKAFKKLVNKKIGNRYAGIVEFDKLEEYDLLVDDENIKETDNIEQSQVESWQTKAGKIDAKTKSSARLREFFSTIPIKTRRIQDNKSVINGVKTLALLSQEYYSGEYIHNKLLLELSDNSNYEDFIKAVNSLVGKYQFAGDIVGAIMDLSPEQIIEAYNNNTLQLPLDLFTNSELHNDYKLWILKDMYYAIGDQSNLQPIKTLLKTKGEQVTEVQIGLSVQNTDFDNAVRTIKETLEGILQDPDSIIKLKNTTQALLDAITYEKPVGLLIKKLFSELGYEASTELLVHLLPTVSVDSDIDNLTNLKLEIQELQRILDGKAQLDVTSGFLPNIAKLISTYSTISSGLSYQNVEGENEFAHQNSNHFSRVGAIWAKGKDSIKNWVNNMRYVDGDPNKAIVLQSYLPMYNDMLDNANTFRIYQDGGTQVEGQTNSGKAYADMTFAELTAHSINLYLTKNNIKNAGNTIKKLHALFHVMVFSDSPKRQMLHAPTYNGELGYNKIVDKLTNIVYGELERVGYAKAQENTSISELEKLSVAGKLIHTIPQLNDVKIKFNDRYISFAEFFATDLWTNPNSAVQISDNTTYKGIDKEGKSFELPLNGGTHRAMVSQIIKETLANDYQHFRDTIYNSDVKKLITSLATDNDIKDYYYNSYYYNISAGIMFSGDPAHYKLKNDSINIERVKRDKQNVAPNIHLAFEKPTYDVIILKDVKANTSNVGNKEVAADLADASAWHTLERRIEILKASPDWELRKNELLPALEAIQNNKYTQKDLQTVHLQLLKPFVYAQVNKELPVGKDVTAYFKLPIQLKNAEAVLLPTEAYRVYGNSESYVRPESLADITADKYYSPELARTLFLMEKANVGTVVFESGSKGEIFGKVNLETYTEADIINMNTDKTRATTILTLKNSDWGLQMEVPRKDLQAKVGQGSQEHKIMSANVDENWSFTLEDKTFKGQQGANELLQDIQTVFAKENLEKLKEELVNEDDTLNINKALEIAQDVLIEKFTTVDVIEGLEIQSDGKTLVPLELAGKKAEKVLNSLFKSISKIKGSGAALVNKTSVGYIRDVEFDKDKGEINLSNDLKLVRDKKGNILHYEAIVPVYNPIIYQFIDNNGELLLDENNKPLIPEKLLYSFFYRIPTEDKYSMFPIKIKKFSMPAEGGGIILPREATQTAGLDFDIDKLYGYYYNFKVNYSSDFRTFVINKFNKFIGVDSTKYFDALEDNTLALDFTDTELENLDILKSNIEPYKKDYEYLGNKFLTKTEDFIFIKLTESSLKNSKSAHNLKLDIYFSLVNTDAYTRDALTPGNKNRLTTLRNEIVGSQYQPKYSYGDPSFIAKSANKNIVGKRLIGIFANGNSFYNLIQGVAKIMLKNPITFIANEVEYTFDSIGGINHQISKNIAELLFASTEDVKDPVLEPLNINTHTAPLLVTLLSMTNGTNIIKFEDAIKLLSDQSILDAVKKAESENKKFTNVYPRDGKYYNLVQMSEKYNAIVSASKIDQAIGPDFFTVQSKISGIDKIITDSIAIKNYPFTSESIKSILPSSKNISKIKQLNIYREALDLELRLFKEVFSFLKPKVLSTLDILEKISKIGKLAPAIKYDIAYYMYDAAIQNLYEKVDVQELIENFPIKLFEYKYPGNTGILKQAFEIDKKGIVKMRWVNTNATNILEQYKEAFSDLFTLDPAMAKELAKYAFLTGTKFKMNSIVKIVPNEFYTTDIGKKIRDILNGNTLEDNLSPDVADIANIIMMNHYKLILPKEEMVINGNTATLKNESFGDPKPFIWDNQEGIDVIYIHTNGSFYTKYHTVEKTKFPNYLINTGINITFAQNNDMTSVTTQSSTSINPLVAAGVKPTDMYGNAAKDIQMAEESTQFIGFQSGTAAVSSTDRYREAWGDKANTGNYSKNDVIMVSGSGLFRGVTEAQIKEVLTNKYKPLLDQAIAAGASFRVGNQYNKGNLSDQLIAEYLKAKGYVEEYLNGYSRWSSSSNTQSDSPLNGDDITPCTKIK